MPTIPDYQSLMLPVLRLVGDRQDHAVAQMRTQLGLQLNLTEAELSERFASGRQTVFSTRVAWAVQFLKQGGTILAVRRGIYKITDRGMSLLNGRPSEITVKTLRQFPEFVEFENRRSGDTTITPPPKPLDDTPEESKDTPEESLENSYQILRDALAEEMLDSIKNGTPAAFEQIVVDLLVAMGYGGSVEDAGKVVGKAGDGGIDGIIKQDKLGLDAIYVQAKRWNNVVGSPEIMKFSGSLTRNNASRGVFITTSTFTRDASDFVERLPQKIVLIDGEHLASLMIEHDVGVSLVRTYTVKRLDQDYFDNL
jgi:restriction system protein